MLKQVILSLALAGALLAGMPSIAQAVEPVDLCVDVSEVLEYLRSEPNAIPDAEVFLELDREPGRVVLQLTQTPAPMMLATDRVVVFRALSIGPQLRVAAVDEQGCFLKLNGTRSRGDEMLWGVAVVPLEWLTEVLAKIGVGVPPNGVKL